ncbi:MAG: OsmC family protein [Leptospirales bacterium]|nr:OsmC family protein [Leptospirales bacterium]
MSLHNIQLRWRRGGQEFDIEKYDRNHELEFEGGQRLLNSAAPDYKGDPSASNPEELLAASLSSCHMLTFLAVAAKARFVIDEYEDQATATLEKNQKGLVAVTRVVLRPLVRFSGENQPDAGKLQELHEKAHKFCMIANSVNCEVVIESRS